MEATIDAGAEDVESSDDGSIEVLTTPEDFRTVKEALKAAGFEPDNAEVAMIPQTYNPLDQSTGAKLLRLLDNLEDLDDVQNVYTNADFPEDLNLD
jgi:transcriptional/translational regulatory protein YebC/TACO1